MTREEAKKRLEVWLKCGECPEDKRCYDSHLHSTCEYTDYCDEVSIKEAIKVAIEALKQEPCEDAISREAVLDITWEEPSYTDAMNVLTEVRDKVKELPSVNPKQKWIPVSERLPEIHQDVLLSLRNLDVEVGFRGETEPYYYCNGYYVEPKNVLAWQPLPEPYKSEGSKE